MRKKIYPKMTKDRWWIKFFFNDNERHYTLRFAGKPLFYLEKAFYRAWWKDFNKIYNLRNTEDENDVAALALAVSMTEEALAIIEDIYKDWMSAFVIYADDFSNELSQWLKK